MSEVITKRPKPLQKLVSFTEQDFDVIKNELEDGWRVVSLVATGSRYVGVIEEIEKGANDESVYIPPRKKIKFVI
jgi:hypothetical protein